MQQALTLITFEQFVILTLRANTRQQMGSQQVISFNFPITTRHFKHPLSPNSDVEDEGILIVRVRMQSFCENTLILNIENLYRVGKVLRYLHN